MDGDLSLMSGGKTQREKNACLAKLSEAKSRRGWKKNDRTQERVERTTLSYVLRSWDNSKHSKKRRKNKYGVQGSNYNNSEMQKCRIT